MADILQVIGALLILAPFTLLQIGYWQSSSASYILSNLIGSSTLAVLALIDSQWGFLLLEGCWAVVAAWATLKLVRRWTRPEREAT